MEICHDCQIGIQNGHRGVLEVTKHDDDRPGRWDQFIQDIRKFLFYRLLIDQAIPCNHRISLTSACLH